MGYTEDLLATNESIVYRTKQHWMAPIFGTVTGVLILIGGVVLFGVQLTLATDGVMGFLRTVAFWASLGLIIFGVVRVGYSYIQWWVEDYAVTNQKVVKVAGLFRKRTSGAALEKINDVVMEQGPLGRMLHYGTLQVSTASDSSDLTYETMRAPADFRRAMLDQKMVFEQADARSIADAVRAGQTAPQAAAPQPAPAAQPAPMAPMAPVAAATIATQATAAPMPAPAPVAAAATSEDKLRSLAKMRDDGLITAEDFEAKKAELLADM